MMLDLILGRCYFTDRSVGIPKSINTSIAGVTLGWVPFQSELFVGKRVESGLHWFEVKIISLFDVAAFSQPSIEDNFLASPVFLGQVTSFLVRFVRLPD